MPPFELMYCKPKQPQLFETLEQAKTGLHNLQNYIPMYCRFFLLSESNHNSIGLNHRHHVTSVTSGANKNIVMAQLNSEDDTISKTTAFIKYSPLLDPIKYLSGKYDMQAPDLLALPTHEDHARDPHTMPVYQKKMHDVNNSSYVDAFFTYLTSRVLHEHGFVHGLDFYGSYLANQDEFTVNIYDELDYFSTCDFFLKHRDELFRLDETTTDFFNSTNARTDGSMNKHAKPVLRIGGGDDLDLDVDLEFNELTTATFDGVFVLDTNEPSLETLEALEPLETLDALELDPVLKSKSMKSMFSQSSDSCSSRSSSDEDSSPSSPSSSPRPKLGLGSGSRSGSDSDSDSDSGSDNTYSDGDDDDDDDEVFNAHIYNFPVHAIMMEKCDNTLDSLMCGKNELTESEWTATLLQVIMVLIAYQHMFAFTHNDLHTNNIMFVKTDKKFLHYSYNGVYYRVPTHGRIMKIIDFGRAIYKYRGQTMCSDSFDRSGDAATQYNCEPYMNPKKPRLEPNFSFDLCRLACSLFDYFVEDIRDEAEYAATLKESRIASVVVDWLKDDKGRNVLYKKNGDERYPEFKLYKMIARTVHGAVPHEQLLKPVFAHYAVTRKQINGKPPIINIDALPSYTQMQSN